MILTGTALRIFEINVYEEAVQAEGFSDYEVRGGIFQIRFLLRQKGRGNA